jgi:hypothetical protein
LERARAAVDRLHLSASRISLRSPPARIPLLQLLRFSLWDILFGTFRNPREFRGGCGFEAGGDRKIGQMLGFSDANAPIYGNDSRGVKPHPAPA